MAADVSPSATGRSAHSVVHFKPGYDGWLTTAYDSGGGAGGGDLAVVGEPSVSWSSMWPLASLAMVVVVVVVAVVAVVAVVVVVVVAGVLAVVVVTVVVVMIVVVVVVAFFVEHCPHSGHTMRASSPVAPSLSLLQ